jgi:hypothetical protein
MKTLFGPCQAVPTHPESVRRSLNRFAIAAILAGASWLALASPAEAKIVYVTDNVTITGDGVITLLKNGPVEFTIQAAYSSGSCGILGLGVYHDASVSATATTGSGVEAGALSNGDPIGPTQSFNKGESLMASEPPDAITFPMVTGATGLQPFRKVIKSPVSQLTATLDWNSSSRLAPTTGGRTSSLLRIIKPLPSLRFS